jgi:cell division septation protein DedD
MPERKRTTSTKAEPAKAEVAKAKVAKTEPAAPKAYARGGWLIQIGAFEGEDEARQHHKTRENSMMRWLLRRWIAGFERTLELRCELHPRVN